MNGSALDHLLSSCPFLRSRLLAEGLDEESLLDLPTVVYGGAAGLVIRGLTSPQETDCIFDVLNTVAQQGGPSDLDVIATGAIEMFNDRPAAQRLARAKLKGPALQILEDMRIGWGQPDYGA